MRFVETFCSSDPSPYHSFSQDLIAVNTVEPLSEYVFLALSLSLYLYVCVPLVITGIPLDCSFFLSAGEVNTRKRLGRSACRLCIGGSAK